MNENGKQKLNKDIKKEGKNQNGEVSILRGNNKIWNRQDKIQG